MNMVLWMLMNDSIIYNLFKWLESDIFSLTNYLGAVSSSTL